MTDLIGLAERAAQRALGAGADEADAFVTSSELLVVEVERSSIKITRRVVDGGVGVRAIVRGSVGFAYANQLSAPPASEAARSAAALAKAGTPDPDFKALPSASKPKPVVRLFDRRVAEAEPRAAVELLASAADAVGNLRGVYSVNMTYVLGHQIRALATSTGFQGQERLSAVDCSAEVVAREDGASFSSSEWGASRRLGGVDPEAIVHRAAGLALRGLKGTKLATATLPVVFDPVAAAFILGGGLGAGLSAEAIQRNRSYLAGKLGKPVASDLITVVDDATVPGGMGSYAFDGEGAAGQRHVVISRGELRTYLYDSYTAGKEGRKSTGNALREGTGPHLWSYRAMPGISPSNLVVKPGRGSLEDLLSEVKRGIYLRLTFDRPNLATGEFSGLVNEGFLIEGGELTQSLRETTVGIHMTDLLKGTEALSGQPREVFGVSTPALLVRRAKIAGSGG